MNSTEHAPKATMRRSTSFSLLAMFGILGVAAYYFDAGPRVMTYIMYLQEGQKVRIVKDSINKANPFVKPTENDETTPRVMSAMERAIQLKPESQPNAEPVAAPETPTVPSETVPSETVPAGTVPETKTDEPGKESPKE